MQHTSATRNTLYWKQEPEQFEKDFNKDFFYESIFMNTVSHWGAAVFSVISTQAACANLV